MILAEEYESVRDTACTFAQRALAPHSAEWEAAGRVSRDGKGYTVDYDVERIYRAVRGARICEGTNDIQLIVISRALTGH